MDVILESVIAVFDFIYSILDTIITTITLIVELFYRLFAVIGGIFLIMPTRLYVSFTIFLTAYIAIMIYKILRKG